VQRSLGLSVHRQASMMGFFVTPLPSNPNCQKNEVAQFSRGTLRAWFY